MKPAIVDDNQNLRVLRDNEVIPNEDLDAINISSHSTIDHTGIPGVSSLKPDLPINWQDFSDISDTTIRRIVLIGTDGTHYFDSIEYESTFDTGLSSEPDPIPYLVKGVKDIGVSYIQGITSITTLINAYWNTQIIKRRYKVIPLLSTESAFYGTLILSDLTRYEVNNFSYTNFEYLERLPLIVDSASDFYDGNSTTDTFNVKEQDSLADIAVVRPLLVFINADIDLTKVGRINNTSVPYWLNALRFYSGSVIPSPGRITVLGFSNTTSVLSHYICVYPNQSFLGYNGNTTNNSAAPFNIGAGTNTGTPLSVDVYVAP